MPRYYVPTGIIVEAESREEAQYIAYRLMAIAMGENDRPEVLDYWTYDLDDETYPVEMVEYIKPL